MYRSNRRTSGVGLMGLLLVSTTAAACATTNAPAPFTEAGAEERDAFDPTNVDPDLISHEEIQHRGQNAPSAMDLIRRLRPRWLSPRGQNSFTSGRTSYPIVYIDEIRHGGLPTLHSIPTAEILRLEYFNTADATTRWGTGHTAGVINVVTGRS